MLDPSEIMAKYDQPSPSQPKQTAEPCRRMLFRVARRTAASAPARRRKMAVVRLGGRRGWRGKRLFVGFLRRLRLRWLVAQYQRTMKRLRVFYAAAMRDLIVGAASIEAVHSRIMAESHFAAPFMPVATSAYYFR